MLEQLKTDAFEYTKLSPAEQKARGILGRLIGPCAAINSATRNGRGYSEQLWENVFSDSLMQEKLANRCCFGELGHPVDRTAIDMEKVALCLAEAPKKGRDGKLYAVFDILSTPNGKILKSLCDYGCKIGISSRGKGDIINDLYGKEEVDPDTYECECFDAVLMPGVECARLKYVTEELHKTENTSIKKTLSQVLNESLKYATNDKERAIMEETIKDLDAINIPEATNSTDIEIDAEEQSKSKDTKQEKKNLKSDKFQTAVNVITDIDDESNSTITSTEANQQKADADIFLDFLANNFDEDKVKAVCDILDIEVIDDQPDQPNSSTDIDTNADSTDDAFDIETSTNDADEPLMDSKLDVDEAANLESAGIEPATDGASESSKEAINDGSNEILSELKESLRTRSNLEQEVKTLKTQLAVSDAKVNKLNEDCAGFKAAIIRLSEIAQASSKLQKQADKLEENLNGKDAIIEQQAKKINQLVKVHRADRTKQKTAVTEELNTKTEQLQKLSEDLQKVEAAHEAEKATLLEDLKKATTVKEGYRKLANKIIGKYIENKSEMLGIEAAEIQRRLGSSYTVEDVDSICEELKSYQLKVNKLPFELNQNSKIKIRMNETLSSTRAKKQNDDDMIDESLLRLAGIAE